VGYWEWNWTENGHLLLTQGPDIREVDPNGGETVIFSDAKHPSDRINSCGKYLIFRPIGRAAPTAVNLWRADANGANQKQLTFGSNQNEPICSRDGKWVYFVDLGEKAGVIKRVPIDGGQPETVLDNGSSFYSFSPDDKTLLTLEVRDSDHKVMLALRTIGTNEKRAIEADPRARTNYQFLPDGKAVAYIVQEQGVDNLWIQPLDGGPRRQLTHFTSDLITTFAFSPDGSKIGLVRGHADSDAILLRDDTR
jgi:Tol biopolymer transport system component